MKKLLVAVQILTMVFCTSVYAGVAVDGEMHSCDDAAEWTEWKNIIEKFPEDDALRAAYSLRVGICKEIEDGTIDTQRAINIFNRYMMLVQVGR